MKKPILTKIIFLLIIFTTLAVQSCGRKGPLKLPNDEQGVWQKNDKDMYE